MNSYCQELKNTCVRTLPKKKCCKKSFEYGRELFLPPEKRRGDCPIGNGGSVDTSVFGCQSCRTSFLRGVFVSCGTVSDPSKSYSLELRIHSESLADSLFELLGNNSVVPKRRVFRGKHCLYLRKCEDIQSFLFLLGETREAFNIAEGKIRRDFVNNTNRRINCDTRNIKIAVDAAAKETEAIKKLRDSGRLELLDESLKRTAELRLENESANLGELAALHSEKITKSGVYHRLAKLIEESEKIDS